MSMTQIKLLLIDVSICILIYLIFFKRSKWLNTQMAPMKCIGSKTMKRVVFAGHLVKLSKSDQNPLFSNASFQAITLR